MNENSGAWGRVVAVRATCSLALTRSGEMWSWGTGLALGHGKDAESPQLLPKLIEGLPPGASVLRIAAGGNKAACVCADGSTFAWGKFEGWMHGHCYSAEQSATPALLGVY